MPERSSTSTARGPYIADVGTERVLAEIRRRFPAVETVYFGEFTGSWWALVGGRLLEGTTLRQLFEVISEATAPPPWPQRPPPSAALRARAAGALAVPHASERTLPAVVAPRMGRGRPAHPAARPSSVPVARPGRVHHRTARRRSRWLRGLCSFLTGRPLAREGTAWP